MEAASIGRYRSITARAELIGAAVSASDAVKERGCTGIDDGSCPRTVLSSALVSIYDIWYARSLVDVAQTGAQC